MKKDLLILIDEIPKIESKFRHYEPENGICIPAGDFIYDVPEFIEWKESINFELQDIYDRTNDAYVWNIINATGVIHKFNGKSYSERKYFNVLKSSLLVIRKNIDRYYPKEVEVERGNFMMPKLFISHASADKKYIELFVEFLADIGLTNETMFCSSIPDYSIPLGKDIYDYLSSLFQNANLYVVYILSDNYYKSPVCLNEMGAAWVLKNDYSTILLPGFDYKEIKGAVNPAKIGIKFDDDEEMLKKRLGDLRKIIQEDFHVSVPDMRWESKRNQFIKKIKEMIELSSNI